MNLNKYRKNKANKGKIIFETLSLNNILQHIMYNNILSQKKENILFLTINRPSQLNALNKETITELHQCLNKAAEDKEIRVIIMTGAGEKAFVAGADIKEFADFSISEGMELASSGQKNLFDLVEKMPIPVIAAINGFALGGGLELALASHIRIASNNARLGLPEVSLGVIPGYGGTQRLAHMVGRGKANEMVFTAGMISAEEAHQWALVNHVVEQKELLLKAEEIAKKIIKNSGVAIHAAINAINANYTDGINGFEKEIEEFGNCFGTNDFKEGTQAFLNKRKPIFPGK